MELQGTGFTLGSIEANGELSFTWEAGPNKEVELEGDITAPSIDLNGGTLLLTGSGNHELAAYGGITNYIRFSGASKKEANVGGNLDLIGSEIHIQGPVDIQQGVFTTAIYQNNMSTAQLSADTNTNKISASLGININWPLVANAPILEIRVDSGSLISLDELQCDSSTLNVYGDVAFNGEINVETLNVYAGSNGVQVSKNITAAGAIFIQEGDLELTGDSQSLKAETAIKIINGEVKKSQGDLTLVVNNPSGEGVTFGNKVTVGGDLSISGKTTLQGHADIGGRASFENLLINIVTQVKIDADEIVVSGDIITTGEVTMLDFISEGIWTLGNLIGAESEITMHSPWETHGTNINVKKLICLENVTFMNSRKCNLAASGFDFKGPVEGSTAEIEFLLTSGSLRFGMDVDMHNSPLSIYGGVLTAEGNITSQGNIQSQFDVNLVGCGQQSVSDLNVLSGNLNKQYGDLVLTGSTTLNQGNVTVSGDFSINTNELKLEVGDIIVEGNANLDGLVTMGSASDQFVRVGGELTVSNLVKTAVSIYLSGKVITLGTTQPAIRAEGGSVWYCGTLNCAPCGDCDSCVIEIEGGGNGGQEIPVTGGDSCLGDFPDLVMMEECNPTQSPTAAVTDAPTPADTSDSSPMSDSPTMPDPSDSKMDPTSETCEPGVLDCTCLDDNKCNGELTCHKFRCIDSTSSALTPPTQSPISSPTVTSGIDHGFQFSIFWSIFAIAFVFIV